jgi:hypothetical protein
MTATVFMEFLVVLGASTGVKGRNILSDFRLPPQ